MRSSAWRRPTISFLFRGLRPRAPTDFVGVGFSAPQKILGGWPAAIVSAHHPSASEAPDHTRFTSLRRRGTQSHHDPHALVRRLGANDGDDAMTGGGDFD